jgi:hypothetical protein
MFLLPATLFDTLAYGVSFRKTTDLFSTKIDFLIK